MAAEGPVRTYNSISVAGQNLGSGTLRLDSKGIAWKARESHRTIVIVQSDMSALEWLRGGRGEQMKIALKGGNTIRLEGFRSSDYTDLEQFVSDTFNTELTRVNQAVRGWSWGQLDISKGASSNLAFRTGGGASRKNNANKFEEAFEIPLGKVANVQLPAQGKELALDFHVDDTAGKMDEELVEMRFYIPEEEEAKTMYEKVKARADTSAFAGESLCSFTRMGVTVPRGRYDVDMYANYIKLRGRAVDFKILYSSITRLFLLPKPDNIIVSFVMSLDPPIRQGNTIYPHLVFQFDTEEKIRIDLPIPAEELQEKYNGKLSENEEGFTWRVFSKILKHLSATPLHVPKSFKSSEGGSGVRTALGANEGFLFFLETCCFFVNKPPTYIRYDDIEYVEFRRMDLERRFDLFVSLSNGSSTTHLFSNIERTEFEPIFKFLYESKKVPVENAEQLIRTGGRQNVQMEDLGGSSESEDDDDFDPNAPESHMANGGSSRRAAAEADDGEPSESESEEDNAELEQEELEDVSHSEKAAKTKRPKKRARK